MASDGAIIIRLAVWADLLEVSALLGRTWHDTYDALYGHDRVAELTGRWHSLDALAPDVDRDDALFLVAESGETIVATALITLDDDGTALLDRLYVAPEAQGLGVGHRLFSTCMAAVGDRAVRLEVEPRNARAIGFYERLGFRADGTTTDCGSTGDGLPALVMRRDASLSDERSDRPGPSPA